MISGLLLSRGFQRASVNDPHGSSYSLNVTESNTICRHDEYVAIRDRQYLEHHVVEFES